MSSKPTEAEVEQIISSINRTLKEEMKKKTFGRFNIRLSSHFLERLKQRASWDDLKTVNRLLQLSIRNRICEMIYWSQLENKPERMELKEQDILIGVKFSPVTNTFIVATFVNYNIYDGHQQTFVLYPMKK